MTSSHLNIYIVLASHNGEKYIQKQIESILNQTYPITAVHVFDDCSTDNTVEILKDYEREGKIYLHSNQQNLGLIENFKRGINLLSNDGYIALSDQDDIWEKHKIEDSVTKMLEIEKDVSLPSLVYSDLIIINDNDEIISTSFWEETDRNRYQHCLETVLFGNVVNGCTSLFNNSMAKYARDIPNNTPQNHDAWLALIAFSFGQIGIVDKPTVNYRQHDENVTFSIREKKESFFRKVRKNIFFIFKPSFFMRDQFDLINSFYQAYLSKLEPSQKLIFLNFLKLQGKNYFTKKRYILSKLK